MKKIKVGFSENDLQELLEGASFEWVIGGRLVYLYNQDKEPLCENDDCFNEPGEDGEVCDECNKKG